MKINVIASCLILLVACSAPTETNSDLPPISEVFDRFYQENVILDPTTANMRGEMVYMDTLPNNLTESYNDASLALFQSYLDTLKMYDSEDLTEDEQFNYELLKWHCELMSGMDPAIFTMLPINQFWSQNLMITIQATGNGYVPFNTTKDFENWLSRLEDYTSWLDQALINMQKGLELGYKQPKAITEKAIPQWEGIADMPTDQHLFYTPILNMTDSISSADSLRLAESYTTLIDEELKPRYQDITDFLKNDYLSNPRSSAGISSVPDGGESYQQLLKFFTTTNLTPDSIFNLGMSEVERIRGEMLKVKDEVGFEGSLNDFFDHIRTNKDLMPFTDPQQVIDNFYAIHEKMKPQLEKQFDMKPKTPFEVRRTEAFRERSAQAQYNPGNPDGSRAGIFYIPVPDVTSYNTYRDEVLFLHEAIPGHHYQIMLELENENIVDFRRYMFPGSYYEGWGLYCEALGKELGLLDDPYQYFGMLSMEMHRAIRLVVDVGLHHKDWTREEAIQFSLDNEPESEAAVIVEIERYMVLPGQATSYKIGQLTILALREKAKEALGDQFDIRDFHRQILEDGALPLAVLEKKIDNWIASEQAM